MYNLIIGYTGPSESENEVIVSASRFLEYTDSETQMRYRNLNADNVRELKDFPALFMQEHCSDGAFVANITNITRSYRDYKITFERDDSYGVIPKETIEDLAIELGIEEFEFYRTHWAVKSSNLANILSPIETPARPTSPVEFEAENLPPEDGSSFNKNQVFIVHGHDEHAKNDVKAYVESKGLEPIILHLQASGGRTIIEKIDHYSNVGFGIVLYTECDLGAKRDTLSFKWRARQNVVFEHGYLIAKLSRERVAALVKGSVETPNDISGVVYVSMDAAGTWKDELDAELRNAGYEIPNS
ncbi:nucleotide-binding protein [Vibrio parahaemolyticus]|uniref:TIR domain-containing protein n=1 Tax=Vibrio parahaemolyticus TaxID=670 RepID=UPI00193DBF14|nr:nucleotide-binding protein [Vibrio parahaemolyticus]EHR0574865.1 nucleotide-binding protein [Vibrio parahaemolyticus]EJG0942866.1 nucleotide-binding protein [Vibrio parahaemolyticus O1]EME0114609.1 nucleotide-binding protein [Vibrio parahaemolyticus]MCZ6299033.1 nucleotide-binding protein [Vibrio parahaemolyticus]